MSGETEVAPSGWTTDTMAAHLQRQLDDLRRMLDERYQTQTKAVDAAFLAQQTAMQTALTAAERAVATALLSAEKAVAKAETAADKRFESVNEFRAQLADQSATFLTRLEFNARFDVVESRLTHLEGRLDTMAGARAGAEDQQSQRRASTQQTVAVVGAVLFAVSIAVALILGFNG